MISTREDWKKSCIYYSPVLLVRLALSWYVSLLIPNARYSTARCLMVQVHPTLQRPRDTGSRAVESPTELLGTYQTPSATHVNADVHRSCRLCSREFRRMGQNTRCALQVYIFRCSQRTVPRAEQCGPVLHAVSAPVTESELGRHAVVCQEAVHAVYLVRGSLSFMVHFLADSECFVRDL